MSENESRLTHAWVTSRTQWVTSRTPWVTSRTPWVTSRTQWVTSRTQWVTSDACTSHVTNSMSHMHETRHKLNATHVWVTPHTQYIETRLRVIAISVCERSSHVSHMNASYLSHRWVTSLTHISRVSIYSLLSLYHLIAIERITSCHELNVTNWQWLTSQSTHCSLRITSMLSTSLLLTCAYIHSTPTNAMSHMHELRHELNESRHELNATQSTFRTHSLRSLIRLED